MLSHLIARPSPQRILIVEDHRLLIYGIKILLSAIPAYEVVGEIVNGLNVYAACQELNPDLVLIDLGLPGMDGIDVIRQLKQRRPELTIVVITADASEHRARDALAAGALGFILKKSSQQVLLAALKTALAGQIFLDPELNLVNVTSAPNFGGLTNLTTRERQILKLIAEGDRNRDISEKLSISIKTVETHRLNLMRKLGAHNIADLVNWACRLGIH